MTVAISDVIAVLAGAMALVGAGYMVSAGAIDFTRDADRKRAAYRKGRFGAYLTIVASAVALIIILGTKMPLITWTLTP